MGGQVLRPISTGSSCGSALDAGEDEANAQSRATDHPTHRKEKSMKRLIFLLLLVAFSSSFITACNTMAGAGKDVQKAGEKVEDKAEDCKDAHC
jgi:predicted small secreted protein